MMNLCYDIVAKSGIFGKSFADCAKIDKKVLDNPFTFYALYVIILSCIIKNRAKIFFALFSISTLSKQIKLRNLSFGNKVTVF